MKLTRLKLYNFKSYVHCDFDLSKITACSIVGANGAGKSTLAEAIVWALFSYTKHASAKELMHPNTENVAVDLWFTIDDQEYYVSREYRDGSMKAKASVNDQPMTQYASGVSPALIQALGASRELVAE